MTYYYGFQHRFGVHMFDNDGDLIGSLHRFTTRQARDAWVEAGNPYLNDAGARSALSSRYAAKFQRMSAADVIEGA